MDFVTAVKTCFQKYFTFSGRARRSEFWWFILFTFILSVVTTIIDGIILGWETTETTGPINAIASLAVFFPSLAVGFRRLHDTNRSGWWLGGGYLAIIVFAVLMGALAFSGDIFAGQTGLGIGLGIFAVLFLLAALGWAITILVFNCQDSDRGTNQYGPSPKYDTGAEIFD